MACCCSCKNLDTKKKANGHISGTKYYCKKAGTYVSGDTDACGKYESCFRSNSDIEKIYNEGKKWSDDTTPIGVYFFMLIVLLIILLIVYIFVPGVF